MKEQDERVVARNAQRCKCGVPIDTHDDTRGNVSHAVLDPAHHLIWFRFSNALIITASSLRNRVGRHVYSFPGVEEVWAPHYEAVLADRQPRTVRRFWRGAVHESSIEYDDGGLYIETRVVCEMPSPEEYLTISHVVESLNRVLAALEAGVDQRADAPSHQGAHPGSHGQPRLRVLPAP